MRNKAFALKSVVPNDQTGSFEGFLAVYKNKDSQGDVIEPGAFSKSIEDSGGMVPLLWQHDTKAPIGVLQCQDTLRGLHVTGKLLVDEVRQAKEAYALLKAGALNGLSIGFEPVKIVPKADARHLTEIRLYEGSLVTFPANPLARVTAVKSEADVEALLQDWRDSILQQIRR